jgi:hypothetical protein
VFIGPAECDLDCVIPEATFSPLAFLAANVPYLLLPCLRPVIVRVVAGDGTWSETRAAAMDERGAYTLLVLGARNAQQQRTSVVVDVPGDFALGALVACCAAIFALVLAHAALPYALVRCGCKPPPFEWHAGTEAGLVAEAASGTRQRCRKCQRLFSACTLQGLLRFTWRFWGYDKRVAEIRAGRGPMASISAAFSACCSPCLHVNRGVLDEGGESQSVHLVAEIELSSVIRPDDPSDNPRSSSLTSAVPEQQTSHIDTARGALSEEEGREVTYRSEITSPSPRNRAEATPGEGTEPQRSSRVRAIDAFRGACLCFMVLFNAGGGGYWFLEHAPWNGVTLADLVFPMFVWTQGVSMAISYDSLQRKNTSRLRLALKTLTRSLKLYALGCLMNAPWPPWPSEWRLLGVLQYFSVSYLIVGLLVTFIDPQPAAASFRASTTGSALSQSLSGILCNALWDDVGRYWAQWGVMLALAGVYLGVSNASD